MTKVCCIMLSDDEDSLDKCRERRRRRFEMRRLAVISAAESPPPNQNPRENPGWTERSADSKRIQTVEYLDFPAASSSSPGMTWRLRLHRKARVRRASRFSGHYRFRGGHVRWRMRFLYGRAFPGLRSVASDQCISSLCLMATEDLTYSSHQILNVAALCRERMHEFVEEELTRVSSTGESERSSGTSSRDWHEEHEGFEERWRRVMMKSFERMNEVALSTCACGSGGYRCRCHPMEVALCGSTAVVALLSPEHIVVANCGDSRAVLCRAGTAVPLSQDHKPDRSDELARIEAAGGRVIFVNGARVQGILAMSRAIGDKYLKPFVTSEPEITFTKREPEDECLILASDGLWDVLSSELACEVARECLREVTPAPASAIVDSRPLMEDEGTGALYPSRSVLAAALLTRLALGRKSSDNISVIVVDLKKS